MKLIIIYTDAGGGHRRTAEVLKSTLEKRHAWDIKLVNVYKAALHDIDPCHKVTPHNLENVYNHYVLQNDRFGFVAWPFLALVYLFMRVCRWPAVCKRLSALWQREQPDVVISVMPLLNKAINQTLNAYDPSVPSLTIVTDFAEYLYKSWFAASGEAVVCGTRKCAYQARRLGYTAERILPTQGMIVDPAFLQKPDPLTQQALIQKHGFDPDVPIGLVIYGGYGNPHMCQIAKYLEKSRRQLQIVFVCGHSTELYDKMRRLSLSYQSVVLPFIDNVADYVHLSNFVITKPGPGSLAECFAAQKPVITELNIQTLLHERYNAKWLKRHGFGFVMRRYAQLPKLVDRLLAPPVYQKIMKRLSYYQNTALEDTVGFVERLTQRQQADRPIPKSLMQEQLELTV